MMRGLWQPLMEAALQQKHGAEWERESQRHFVDFLKVRKRASGAAAPRCGRGVI